MYKEKFLYDLVSGQHKEMFERQYDAVSIKWPYLSYTRY